MRYGNNNVRLTMSFYEFLNVAIIYNFRNILKPFNQTDVLVGRNSSSSSIISHWMYNISSFRAIIVQLAYRKISLSFVAIQIWNGYAGCVMNLIIFFDYYDLFFFINIDIYRCKIVYLKLSWLWTFPLIFFSYIITWFHRTQYVVYVNRLVLQKL